MKDLTPNLTSELRRGTLVLCVLSQLGEKQYGYSLLQRLSENGVEVDQNTLYPLLRRLEDQGLLESEWSLEGSRPRRYYVLSEEGRKTLRALKREWYALGTAVARLLRKDGEEDEGRAV